MTKNIKDIPKTCSVCGATMKRKIFNEVIFSSGDEDAGLIQEVEFMNRHEKDSNCFWCCSRCPYTEARNKVKNND